MNHYFMLRTFPHSCIVARDLYSAVHCTGIAVTLSANQASSDVQRVLAEGFKYSSRSRLDKISSVLGVMASHLKLSIRTSVSGGGRQA